MIVMLGLAALSAAIGLAAIIGAFLAGMVVGESSERDALEKETAPVAALFTPFFFGFIGAQIDPTVFGTPSTVALLLGITALAIVTKFAGRSSARCVSVVTGRCSSAGPWSRAGRSRSSWRDWPWPPGRSARTSTWWWLGWWSSPACSCRHLLPPLVRRAERGMLD